MRMTFYKSLDRQLVVFGLRGSWIRIFLYCAGGVMLLAFTVGFIMGRAMGYTVAVVGLIVAFFFCLMYQVKLPTRRMDKAFSKGKMRQQVIRRETLSHIVLGDPGKGRSGLVK